MLNRISFTNNAAQFFSFLFFCTVRLFDYTLCLKNCICQVIFFFCFFDLTISSIKKFLSFTPLHNFILPCFMKKIEIFELSHKKDNIWYFRRKWSFFCSVDIRSLCNHNYFCTFVTVHPCLIYAQIQFHYIQILKN